MTVMEGTLGEQTLACRCCLIFIAQMGATVVEALPPIPVPGVLAEGRRSAHSFLLEARF